MALFGTNGVRGVANVDMTAEMAMNLAKSIGTFRNGRDRRRQGHAAVGRHAEERGDRGFAVDGLLPWSTWASRRRPASSTDVKSYADAGIVITASHNPPEYNGLKGIAGDGTEMSRQDEAVVEKIFYAKAVQKGELERDRRDRLRRPEAGVHRRHYRPGGCRRHP